jgi:hypothetical protein
MLPLHQSKTQPQAELSILNSESSGMLGSKPAAGVCSSLSHLQLSAYYWSRPLWITLNCFFNARRVGDQLQILHTKLITIDQISFAWTLCTLNTYTFIFGKRKK